MGSIWLKKSTRDEVGKDVSKTIHYKIMKTLNSDNIEKLIISQH
jgi:hypothetical protein